jgi:hypothetical protein
VILSCFRNSFNFLHRQNTTEKNLLQRAPVGIVLSSSGTSQFGMFDIQATTKYKYYDHIVLLYLESRRCRYNYHVYKHYKGFVYFNYTYRLLFIALFDDFNLIITIFHWLCPSFYLYLSNLLS